MPHNPSLRRTSDSAFLNPIEKIESDPDHRESAFRSPRITLTPAFSRSTGQGSLLGAPYQSRPQ